MQIMQKIYTIYTFYMVQKQVLLHTTSVCIDAA